MKNRLNCIVVIDDDGATNFLTGLVLEKAQCSRSIKFFQKGHDALEYLNNCGKDENTGDYATPNLILLDINMPAMNGWEFLDQFKSLKILNEIKVVMLTTSLFPEDRIKAERHEHISAFELKPISVIKIKALIEKLFKQALL